MGVPAISDAIAGLGPSFVGIPRKAWAGSTGVIVLIVDMVALVRIRFSKFRRVES